VLLAVFSSTFLVRFAFGITLAVFASYINGATATLGQGDVGVVGIVSAMAPVGELSTVLLAGAAADRYGRFPVLFSGIGASAVIFALKSTTRAPLALGGLNLLFGVASGAILAASLALVADWSGLEERGYEMGRFDAMNLFGWVGGYAFGFGVLGLVSNSLLGVVFLIGSAVLAAGLGIAWWLVRGLPIRHAASGYVFSEVLAHVFRRSVLLVTLPWLVIYMLIGTALAFLGLSAGGIGISTTYLAPIIGGGGFLLVLTQPYFGRLSDRTGRMRMMTVGTIGFVLLMVFASLAVAYGPQVGILVGLGASVLPALAYGPAALAALADLSAEMSRATTMAIYSLTISAGMVLGLVSFTLLYATLGNVGLYLFFGSIAVGLVAFTFARYHDAAILAREGLTIPAR
jgi:MFS family permease